MQDLRFWEKSRATVSSFADGVNMVVEGQFRVDV